MKKAILATKFRLDSETSEKALLTNRKKDTLTKLALQ